MKGTIAVLALVIFTSGCIQLPTPSNGNPLSNILPLGPGSCIDETSCRAYCDDNIQDCIKWCSENENPLCEVIAREYTEKAFGNSLDDDVLKDPEINVNSLPSGTGSLDCDTTPSER